MGLRFTRQKIIGHYIVDFYCHEKKIVIEIDGTCHDDRVEYDKERDEYMQAQDLKIIRIKASEIMSDINKVMERLKTPDALSGATPFIKGGDNPELEIKTPAPRATRGTPFTKGGDIPDTPLEFPPFAKGVATAEASPGVFNSGSDTLKERERK